jgi:uncharacterized damage-inducible protein DinB
MNLLLRKRMLLSFLLSGMLLLSGTLGQAQTLSSEDIRGQFIKDWERAKAYTVDYLNAMPADKYSFKAVDSIRSFAQQMLHLSMANVNLMSVATGQERIFGNRNLEMSAGAQTKDSVMYFVTTSYDYAMKSLKSLDVSKWGEKTGRGNLQETRFAWILKAFEHQTHHRGQATIYIRLLGIRPPNERLF